MRNSQIIDRSQHQIDEQAVGEENDEQEMLAMKMKAVGINPDLHMLRRPFSMRGSLNMIVRKNEQKNIIEGNRVSKVLNLSLKKVMYMKFMLKSKLTVMSYQFISFLILKLKASKN